MASLHLPCYDIVINYDEDNPHRARIFSNLCEVGDTDDISDNDEKFNAAMDALEAMILAHFCAGIDVSCPAYLEGIETAVQACGNYFS